MKPLTIELELLYTLNDGEEVLVEHIKDVIHSNESNFWSAWLSLWQVRHARRALR